MAGFIEGPKNPEGDILSFTESVLETITLREWADWHYATSFNPIHRRQTGEDKKLAR